MERGLLEGWFPPRLKYIKGGGLFKVPPPFYCRFHPLYLMIAAFNAFKRSGWERMEATRSGGSVFGFIYHREVSRTHWNNAPYVGNGRLSLEGVAATKEGKDGARKSF